MLLDYPQEAYFSEGKFCCVFDGFQVLYFPEEVKK